MCARKVEPVDATPDHRRAGLCIATRERRGSAIDRHCPLASRAPGQLVSGAGRGKRMDPRQVRTAADALKIVEERGLTHVKIGVHDVDGILRGKYLHVDKLRSALQGGPAGGVGFCDVVLGWDSND